MDLIINNHKIITPIYDIVLQLQEACKGEYLESVTDKGDYISVTCPFHKDGKENKPSASIYARYDTDILPGKFHCFTCDKVADLPQLVSHCLHISISSANSWLIKHSENERQSRASLDIASNIILEPTQEKEIYQTFTKDGLEDWHPYLDKRHLDREVCQYFNVKYDPKTKYIIFPVNDEKGHFSFVTKRSTIDKTFFIEKGVEKAVYLLDEIKKNNFKTVYVCESQINALTLWGWKKPAIALFGCKATPNQIDLLNHSGINHYLLCLDGDKAGWGGMLKFIKDINQEAFVDVIIVPRGKDVNDLTQEEFESLPIIDSLSWQRGDY